MNLLKKSNLNYLLIITCFICFSCKEKKIKTYNYKTVPNDLFELKTYTLKNGLKLYLSPNKNEPSVETRIVINGGSTVEDSHTTGLAHYLEHLLFNGTDSIGSFNYEKEKPLLDEIRNLFERHRKTTNSNEKRQIYSKIDSLSHEASKYSSLNEYRDLLVKLKSPFINAYTRPDRTGYMCKIPANQLEKWVNIEAERFRNPVFRGFHTELETVYEELNSYYGNGFQLAKIKLYENTFPSGEFYKGTLGKPEHLKNPSLIETQKYFDTYYVPNNMAIILAGDFDPDLAIKLIEEKFGNMEPRPLPERKTLNTPFLKSNIETTITTPEEASIAMGYVTLPPSSDDAYIGEFSEMLFYNGRFDLTNIGGTKSNSNWINSTPYAYKDFTFHYIEASPKNKSLNEFKDMVTKDIDRLKTGDYPDWLIGAVAKDYKNRLFKYVSENRNIVYMLSDIFSHNIPLDNFFSNYKKFETITKSDISGYAKKYYKNYSVVYKKQGTVETLKVEKPAITPLSGANDDNESNFSKKIIAMTSVDSIKPILLNFNKDIEKIPLKNKEEICFVKNTVNDLFNLKLVFNNGKNDKLLVLANEYIKLALINENTSKSIKKELYKIGCSIEFQINSEDVVIAIDGISESFEKAIQLVTQFLTNIVNDKKLAQTVIKSEIEKINNQKNNKYSLLNRAIDCVKYSSEFVSKNVITKNYLENVTSEMIITKTKELFNYKYRIYLYDSRPHNDIANIFNKNFVQNTTLKTLPETTGLSIKPDGKNNVFLIDSKGSQVDIVFLTKQQSYDPDKMVMNTLFKEYFTFIISNEIREKRALAYSAFSNFSDNFNNKPKSFYTKTATQTDKYLETLKINHQLIRDLPFNDESLFEKSKSLILGSWNSKGIPQNKILSHYKNATNKGFNYDYRKLFFEKLPNITFEDLKNYYEKWIKDNYFNLIIVGNLSKIDANTLKQYGDINILTPSDLFGY